MAPNSVEAIKPLVTDIIEMPIHGDIVKAVIDLKVREELRQKGFLDPFNTAKFKQEVQLAMLAMGKQPVNAALGDVDWLAVRHVVAPTETMGPDDPTYQVIRYMLQAAAWQYVSFLKAEEEGQMERRLRWAQGDIDDIYERRDAILEQLYAATGSKKSGEVVDAITEALADWQQKQEHEQTYERYKL